MDTQRATETFDLDGFMEDVHKVRLYRARASLAKPIRLRGKIMSIRDAIRRLAAEGATVTEHPEDGQRVFLPSGSFFIERDLTRTGVQYLRHLLAAKEE